MPHTGLHVLGPGGRSREELLHKVVLALGPPKAGVCCCQVPPLDLPPCAEQARPASMLTCCLGSLCWRQHVATQHALGLVLVAGPQWWAGGLATAARLWITIETRSALPAQP